MQPYMCANFVYDLNGKKDPNAVGKDIGFITAFYPTDSVVVAPIPLRENAGTGAHNDLLHLCKDLDKESRVPNLEEAYSMFVNSIMLNFGTTEQLWTNSKCGVDGTWRVSLVSGARVCDRLIWRYTLRCIKR